MRMTVSKVEHDPVLTERVNCTSFQLSFCTPAQIVRTLANAVTSALAQVLQKGFATLFEDGFKHFDHRLAVFTPQAADRVDFAHQACPDSGLSCSHVALIFCDMCKDWHCS